MELKIDDINNWMDSPASPLRMDMAPAEASKGLAQLALAIVNLLKEVMEKQAMRKMDKELLAEEDIERLGTTFMLLDERMAELKTLFGLTDEDLQIGLGAIADLDSN